jgi:hypothetical protein
VICGGLFCLSIFVWGVALLARPGIMRRVRPYERWLAMRFYTRDGDTPETLTDDQIRFYAIVLVIFGVIGTSAILLGLLAERQGVL